MSAPTEDQTFDALARLPLTDYDRARRTEAKRLHLRLQTLDAEVARRRNQIDEAQANAVKLPTLQPWPEPILDAPALFDAVAARYLGYLFLPPGAADAITLWTAHAHAVAAFRQSPRLNLISAEPGCGKTTTLDVLATMAPKPLRTENLRPAVLFRVVHQQQPTLLLDELDSYLDQANEVRGLLNAGHKPGGCAYRCEAPGNSVRAFNAYAPTALAGLGSLPATLRDRSIIIPLCAAKPGQIPARFDPYRTETETILGRQLARWARDNLPALQSSDPPMPPHAHNRLADNWRPLFAIAHLVGGHWPQRALDAFTALCARPSPDPASATLLADIRAVFAQSGAPRLFSSQIVQSLRTLPERAWSPAPGSNRHNPVLNEVRLARLLLPFGIRPRLFRIDHYRGKGYDLADFTQQS